MIASAHVAAGAAIGILAARKIRPRALQVLVAIAVGIAGHLAMDAIPHSDYAFLPITIVPWAGLGEAFVAIGIVVLLARGRVSARERLPIAAGVFASMAPDVKFVARVLMPSWEDPITRVTDAVHGFHAVRPLHMWLAFGGEVMLAIGFFYIYWRVARSARSPHA
jgi:hypothetical protein